MLTVTNENNQAWRADARQMAVRIKIDNEVYGNDDISTLHFDSGSISGESFQIGSTYMNKIDVTFLSILESLEEGVEVSAELGILVNGIYEYSKLGSFFIDELDRDRNSNTTKITAVDKMLFMGGPYESQLTYPARIKDVAVEIANLAGVEIDQVSFSILSNDTINKLEGYTYRQAIGLIAQFEGGFANFNREGNLQIRGLALNHFTIQMADYMLKGFRKNEKTYRINGIRVKTGDNESDILTIGSDKGNIVELENKAMTQFLLSHTWEKVKDIAYYPFELKWRGNPNLEAGDWVNIIDRNNISYAVPNLSYSFTFNGGLSAESKATTVGNSEVTYAYKGSLSQQVEEIKKVIQSANGWNSNFYDSETEPKNAKEGDLWFKKNGQYTEIWIYANVDGVLTWVLLISDAPNEVIKVLIEDLEKELEDTKDKAQEGLDKAEQAIQNAGFAEDLAKQAQTSANNATNSANQAKQDAINALTNVDKVDKKAQTAIDTATTATNNANQAKQDATNALTNATNAINTANNANKKAIKSHEIAWALHTSGTTAPTTGWQATPPTPNATQFVWGRTTITLNDGTLIYSYTVSKVGGKGDTGPQGASGANAPKITAVKTQRYLSTSNTTQTGGNWSDNIPTWQAGKYYWTRTITTYSDNTTTTSTPVLDNGLNQSLVSAMEAKTETQTLGTTVSQHATQLLAKADKTEFDVLSGTVTNISAEQTIQAGLISQKANQTTVDKLNNRVTTAEGQLTVQAGLIEAKASKTEVDTLKNRVTSAETNIVANTNKINLAATKTEVQTAIDGIEVGGRNLIRSSNKLKAGSTSTGITPSVEPDGTIKVVAISGNGNWHTGWLSSDTGIEDFFNEGDDFTISFTMKKEDESTGKPLIYLKGGMGYYAMQGELSSGWSTVFYTGKWKKANGVSMHLGWSSAVGTFYIKDVKLEKGNKATDWSPAPEDVKADISQVQSNLTIESGRITALNTKTDGHTTQIGKLESSYNGLSSTVSKVQTDLNGKATVVALSSLEQNLNGFKQTVSNTYADKTSVTTLATQWQTTTNLVNGHTSQISSLGDMIDLRVTKKDLIGEINLQVGKTIFRQGDNYLMITPETTYIQDSTIKSAMIDSLNATKITTGTLNAANVNIINLNASKLVADRIDGITLYGSYINGGEIRGNALIYLNNGINNTVLSADNGISTTKAIAAKQQIRSEDWIYAGRTIDGVTTENGGFHGWRVMSNFLDPLQTNGTLAIGQRSTISAKEVHYLDTTFKRYLNVDMALRLGPVSEPPPTAGLGTLWWGTAYAGTGLYVTSPSGTTKSIAIF